MTGIAEALRVGARHAVPLQMLPRQDIDHGGQTGRYDEGSDYRANYLLRHFVFLLGVRLQANVLRT